MVQVGVMHRGNDVDKWIKSPFRRQWK